MSEFPEGIYEGELPPSMTYGRCVLTVGHAAFDTGDDADDKPEHRAPVECTLQLAPNLTGPVLADGIVMGVRPTKLTADEHGVTIPEPWALRHYSPHEAGS